MSAKPFELTKALVAIESKLKQQFSNVENFKFNVWIFSLGKGCESTVCMPPPGSVMGKDLLMLPEELLSLFDLPARNGLFMNRRRNTPREMAAYVEQNRIFVVETIEPQRNHKTMIAFATFATQAFARCYFEHLTGV